MNVKSFYPRRKDEAGRKFLDKVKLLAAKKAFRILLFALAGALLAAAAAVFVLQPSRKPETSPAPTVSGAYEQPESPDAQSDEEVRGSLETELKGYSVIARLDIEKIDQHLPVLSQTSDKALKVSVCYYSGAMPDEEGNFVITGHNYRNGAHFGKLDKLEAGDSVTLTDAAGATYAYTVYKLDHIRPDNPEALDNTAYPSELTLLTCEARGNRRLVVRCAPA